MSENQGLLAPESAEYDEERADHDGNKRTQRRVRVLTTSITDNAARPPCGPTIEVHVIDVSSTRKAAQTMSPTCSFTEKAAKIVGSDKTLLRLFGLNVRVGFLRPMLAWVALVAVGVLVLYNVIAREITFWSGDLYFDLPICTFVDKIEPSAQLNVSNSFLDSYLQLHPDVDATQACVPATLNASAIHYRSNHRFYATIQTLEQPFMPPVFTGKHTSFCNECEGRRNAWDYCLPISGRKDKENCNSPGRMDILSPQTPLTLCYGSPLQMLLTDVYEEFKAMGAKPAILFGTLLGAVRNGSTIPFTEDSDIGYQYTPSYTATQMRDALRRKGYHMFYDGIYRVCIAPTHPLASNLFDPERRIDNLRYNVPYVDLYRMTPPTSSRNALWEIQKMKNNRRVPSDKVVPFSQVEMDGLRYDTVADPIDFLVHEYGGGYMTPQRRGDDR
uniref:Uncharacterized protein n=1 Tax=Globisporangium ultimum (strain ATCC 200006 / CBS 805.95 / DAOM BR144) TaxID=431595 RepID=K3XB33_GLOUD